MAGTAAAEDPIQPTSPAQVPPGAVVQSLGPDAGTALRGYLTTLADNPRSLEALLGAGREALELGDAEASLGFYARADEVSPRNPRVKAGMASAFVQLGQPQAALRLFEEAASLGAPVADFASDRGLAFDMVGDPARAQQEYVLAMRFRDEPELRRRMALSLAITGQRDAALRLIDAQLRGHDRAAWRTQAFVLALTGDAAGANRTAHNVLPAGTAQAMAPFLAQLATLNPSEKAMAVHFGHFPNIRGARTTAVHVAADPGALAFATGGNAPAAATAAPVTRTPAAPTRSTRRRPQQIRDSSDPYRLREARPTSRRSTQTASRPAQPTLSQPPPAPPPPPPSVPPPAASQPAGAEGQAVEVAELQTRWAGAPYSPASTPTVPPPSPTPVTNVQSPPQQSPSATQPRQPPVTTQLQQPAVTTQPQQSTVTTQAAGAATPPLPQAEPSLTLPTTVASNAPILSATIPSASGPDQPPVAVSSPTLPAPLPSQSPPVTASVEPSAQPLIQAHAAPEAGPSVAGSVAPGFSLEPQASQPAPATQGMDGNAFADIAALVNSLPPEERSTPPAPPAPTATPAPEPRRTEPVRTAQNRPAQRSRPAQPDHPSRHWVQIAGGANRAALPRELARLRALAPQQLGRRAAYTASARATNRLLVGPFASSRAAQEFVNQLAGHNVAAFAWTSDAGQEIERLQTR